MKRLLLIFFLSPLLSLGQVIAKKKAHNYGNMHKSSNRVTEFLLTNTGSETMVVEKIIAPEEISHLIKTSSLDPGKSTYLRIKYNPLNIGPFHDSLVITFKGGFNALRFYFSGNAYFVPAKQSLACPNYKSRHKEIKKTFILNLKVLNKYTLAPIPNVKVRIHSYKKEFKKISDLNGEIEVKTTPRYFYFTVEQKGYLPKQFDEFANHHNPDVTIWLTPIGGPILKSDSAAYLSINPINIKFPWSYQFTLPKRPNKKIFTPIPEPDFGFPLNLWKQVSNYQKEKIAQRTKEEDLKEVEAYQKYLDKLKREQEKRRKKARERFESTTLEEIKIKEQKKEIQKPIKILNEQQVSEAPEVDPKVKLPVKKTPELEEGKLSEEVFKANNIVFLIDLSGSMNEKGKLELLKVSIKNLLDYLRPMDQVAFVSYSSQAKVILHPTSIAKRDLIDDVVKSIRVGGTSAGKEGLKKAYQLVKDYNLPNGNNMIIIATDGNFDSINGIKFNIARGNLNKTRLSIIGLKSRGKADASLRRYAESGNGNFIRINNLEDTETKLLHEIKLHSKFQP